MHCYDNSNKNSTVMRLGIVLTVSVIVLFTRAISLTYNMELHPDEHVFFTNTDNLLKSLMNPGNEYIENKEYPEGAYLYHLPFVFLGRLLQCSLGFSFDARLWVRIASVCYFTLTVVLGMRILHRYLLGDQCSLIFYGLIMSFSLFFIEQSRYGVGDMISAFLVLLTIELTIATFSTSSVKWKYLILAFFSCGTLGAVKWPQLFFLCIPSAAYLFDARMLSWKKKIPILLLLLGLSIVAFLMFSPKAATDLHYFVRAGKREVLVYAIEGKAYEDGGLLNHIAQIVIYNCLYSDFPFALFFFSIPVYKAVQKIRMFVLGNTRDVVIHVIVPIICVVFFLYNLFVRMMVFRTYTPYFAISTVYIAKVVSEYYRKGMLQRSLIILLSILLVVRGGYLISIFCNDDVIQDRIQTTIANTVDEKWNRTILINSYIVPFDTSNLVNPTIMRIDSMEDFDTYGIEIQEGDLVITGGYEYGLGGKYIFPVNGETACSRNDAYAAFKEINNSYWRGQTYPDYYYLLFGGWIRGGSLSTFTMPCNYIYYRN